MTHSMTAFARVQKQLGDRTLSWELKSVNHRYFEVSFRLPDAFRYLEAQLRQSLRGCVHRGKLECQLIVTTTLDDHPSIVINTGLVDALVKAGSTIASNEQVGNDLAVSHILAWPGVIQMNALNTIDGLGDPIQLLFKDALTQLLEARFTEGATLKEHVLQRAALLKDEVTQARAHISLTSGHLKEKLLSRLQHIQMQVPESRIEQEIALLLLRCDVSEEFDRLDTHVNEVVRILQCDDAAGRPLDFLMQELNREANTLSSKSDSIRLTQHAVQMKVLIEQMREQIQNIE